MAHSARTVRIAAGTIVSAAVGVLILAVLALIATAASGTAPSAPFPPDLAHLVRMSAIQAATSTICSLAAGAAIAWALNRLRFPGRRLVAALLSAAIVTPAIVVAVGVISVWGRSGWVNAVLSPFGLAAPSPFGFWPIVYAHTVLNAPFAAAIFLARLDRIAPERLGLGRSLRLSPFQRFLHLDRPVLVPAVPGLAAVIFLLTFTSFPVVLLLGGGPANQTFETAIYAATKLNFDLNRAALLAAVQLGLTAIVILPATFVAPAMVHAAGPGTNPWPETLPLKRAAIALLLVFGLALGLPLLAIVADGWAIPTLFGQPQFWHATATSLWIAGVSAPVALALALLVAHARVAASRKWTAALLGLPAFAYLALPGVTLALGLFLGLRRLGLASDGAAPFVVILANALLTLPFALATLTPALTSIARRTDKLAANLRLGSWTRFRHVEFPLIGREVGLVLAMGFGFSLGDLSVISLFGTQQFSTLPWAMHRALGAYRTHDAAAIAAILLVLGLALFFFLPPILERFARARAR